MKRRPLLMVFLAVVMVVLLQTGVQAEIYKLKFNAFTQRSAGQQDQICFHIEVADTALRPPDAINPLTVTAPDGTVFNMKYGWREIGAFFFAAFTAADFNTKPTDIPSGIYTAKVTDKSLPTPKTLTSAKTVTVAFLTPPTLTVTGLNTLTPRISWPAIAGAKSYRIWMVNDTTKTPIYLVWPDPLEISRTYFTIPTGVLAPNQQHSLKILALDGGGNASHTTLAKRSQSAPFSFTAPPAP